MAVGLGPDERVAGGDGRPPAAQLRREGARRARGTAQFLEEVDLHLHERAAAGLEAARAGPTRTRPMPKPGKLLA